MTLPELLDAIAADLRAHLGSAAASVETHPGRFGADDLRRLAARAPAVRVALLGVGGLTVQGNGRQRADCLLAAYVITTDRPGLRDRHEVAGALVGRLLARTALREWAGIDPRDQKPALAEDVRADNLYAGAIDQQGIALWAVSWAQPFVFTPT